MSDFEIKIDDSMFAILAAIANADDDPQSLVDIANIDPNEFREFLINCGEIDNKDGLELLRAAEVKHLSRKAVLPKRETSYRRSAKLYVGNLAFHTTSEELREAFAAVGTVESASVIEDRETGRSRGFAFVEMATEEEAAAAIEAFDGKDFGGRNLTVNDANARARTARSGGRRGGGHRGGRGGHRGGGREPSW
jgi:RNA recognition motif-containing protein